MNRKMFYTLGAAILLLSMALSACGPSATQAPTGSGPPRRRSQRKPQLRQRAH